MSFYHLSTFISLQASLAVAVVLLCVTGAWSGESFSEMDPALVAAEEGIQTEATLTAHSTVLPAGSLQPGILALPR